MDVSEMLILGKMMRDAADGRVPDDRKLIAYLRTKGRKERAREARIDALEAENRELKFFLAGVVRLLVDRGVLPAEEISRLTEIIERSRTVVEAEKDEGAVNEDYLARLERGEVPIPAEGGTGGETEPKKPESPEA